MIIGIIGIGRIGSTLGRLWAAAGHRIVFGSPRPRHADALAAEIGSGAVSRSAGEAVLESDAVFVAVPFKAWPDLAGEIGPTLGRKPVIDATNLNRERDGEIAAIARAHPHGTLGVVADLLPAARLVKALNTMEAGFLARAAHREQERYGVPLAGNDGDAVATAARLVSDAGFDPFIVGSAARAREFDEGTPVWNNPMSAKDLARHFAESTRPGHPR